MDAAMARRNKPAAISGPIVLIKKSLLFSRNETRQLCKNPEIQHEQNRA
jgi:hypothetical protein